MVLNSAKNWIGITIAAIILMSCSFDYGQDMSFTEISFSNVWKEKGIPAERGWIRVPACHREKKCNATIKIPFVKIISTNEKPGTPIFYFAGGPGDSGIQSARRNIYPYLLAFRKISDVVLFDQRGTGDSEPNLKIEGTFNIPGDVTLDSKPALDSIRNLLLNIQKEMDGKGVNLDHYNTVENAIDVDSLRSKLDYDRINIFAHSYGTHLAMAYVKYFERHVNRMVFSGFNGLDQRLILPEDSENFIRRIHQAVRSDKKFNRIFPDFWDTVRRSLDTYESGHALGDSLKFNSFDIQAVTMLRSGDAEFVYALPSFYQDILDGRFEKFTSILNDHIKNRPVGTAMTYTMSTASGISTERRRKITSQKDRTIMDNARNYPFYHVDFRNYLGINDLGEVFRNFDSIAIPTLFINGTFDGRTPVEDAERVRGDFEIETQILIEGGSHDALFSTPALIDLTRNYLNGMEVADSTIHAFYEFRSPQREEIISSLMEDYGRADVEYLIEQIEMMLKEESSYYITSGILSAIGNRLISKEKYKDALVLLTYSHERFPQNALIVDKIGLAHYRLGNRDKATYFAKKFTSMNPFDRRWARNLNNQGIILTE